MLTLEFTSALAASFLFSSLTASLWIPAAPTRVTLPLGVTVSPKKGMLLASLTGSNVSPLSTLRATSPDRLPSSSVPSARKVPLEIPAWV
ncbi:hypothetical protein D3C77_750290 [compost metagenome]